MSAVGLARYKTGYQFSRRRQRTASETRRMFRLAFYEGRPILKSWCSLRALHQNRRRSWLNGKSERQRAEEKRRPAVRCASLANPCKGRRRNAPVPGRHQENEQLRLSRSAQWRRKWFRQSKPSPWILLRSRFQALWSSPSLRRRVYVDRMQTPSSPRKAEVPHLRNQKNNRPVIAVGVAWIELRPFQCETEAPRPSHRPACAGKGRSHPG